MLPETSFINKRVVLSGNKGNLGPIWQKILEDGRAQVFGFDLNKEHPWGINNVDVRSLKLLADFKNEYYKQIKKQDPLIHEFGPPDIIINNAAIDNPPTIFNPMKPETEIGFFSNALEIVDTNLIGAINLTSMFIDDMCRAGRGLIINIGSIQGNIAADTRNYEPGFSKPVGYNVSKAGLIQFTRSLAVQYGKYGIRSVCLAFSAVETGKFKEPFKSKFLNCLPLKKLISKASLEAALKFAVDCPELTGQQILVDSGYTAW